ncbi:MAG: ATP-binding protein [Leptolyngbyaceae cyanobacterium bins.59]|nr:ATP-binding protein [Leptolyngbyaceae cyanobacterium bins.59]
MTTNSDELIFAAESDDILFAKETEALETQASWKILIVDDEPEVHQVTELALRDFSLEGKPLTFLHAYSGAEARPLIQAHSDIAIVFLDVVMETENAGLEVVKYIREALGNQLVRIVLRTGQPGQAPEKTVVVNYDIDAYKTKTELTSQQLFICVVTALRAFATLTQILENNHRLEEEIRQRQEAEAALQERTRQLEYTLEEFGRTQAQLVQSEKMSSLGQLVAGVAHEINNPINFIFGNLAHASEYMQGLLDLTHLYQIHCETPHPDITEKIEELDLDFLQRDLPKLMHSIQVGAQRIREIVYSLRVFSRLDEAEVKGVNIHEGIDSTVMILQNRLKARGDRPAIQVVKAYGAIPSIECYAGQLNQVFMNLISNAIDALEEVIAQRPKNSFTPAITIRTALLDSQHITIQISDNGCGIPEEVQQRMFDPFFTTKAVGKGTGMGLAISYQIIRDKHKGTLKCTSTLGMGTEFTIELPSKVR